MTQRIGLASLRPEPVMQTPKGNPFEGNVVGRLISEEPGFVERLD